MTHTDWFVHELLSFLGSFPVESIELHTGVAHTSVDLLCAGGARVVGLPPLYLQAVRDSGLLPAHLEDSIDSVLKRTESLEPALDV